MQMQNSAVQRLATRRLGAVHRGDLYAILSDPRSAKRKWNAQIYNGVALHGCLHVPGFSCNDTMPETLPFSMTITMALSMAQHCAWSLGKIPLMYG